MGELVRALVVNEDGSRELVIDRAIWARGPTPSFDANCLLTDRAGERKQCCVGIFLSACGVSDDHLLGRGVASSIMEAFREFRLPDDARWLHQAETEEREPFSDGRSAIASELYSWNDSGLISEEEREAKIVELFAKATPPVRVTFIN